ncbi:helix-turn-helix domain-containing protein [Qipengyuania huizhouensis]|uniref:helix-turn-helix domain-containing protein n=1 Tax=Qipengyuania huizhouensis TaxID=2867245 RepID=UPI001C88A5F0|nr:helix-turn-helix domain-containing protein [Qipengyuania huizhouensis]MBX7459536.1 hypothetical protein [Qipengyuania huizhouensis]
MFDVEPHLLPGRSRKKEVVRARDAAIWSMKMRWPEMSYPQIGHRFGGRDHSTIIHSKKKIDDARKRCPEMRRATDLLVTMPLGKSTAVPADLLERLAKRAEEDRLRREKPSTEFKARQKQIDAEIREYADPKISTLKLQLRGEAGCPSLAAEEIETRRQAVIRERKAREAGLLAQEQQRYGLRRRAKPLSEMVL